MPPANQRTGPQHPRRAVAFLVPGWGQVVGTGPKVSLMAAVTVRAMPNSLTMRPMTSPPP
jgi:hypothetical protein